MEAFFGKFRRYLNWLFGVVGLIATAFSSYDLFSDVAKEQTTKSWVALGYSMMIVSIVLFLACMRMWQTIRKEKYANISPHLHQAIHAIRDFQTYVDEREPNGDPKAQENYIETAKTLLSVALSEISNVFRIVTSTNCRTCIKMTYEEGERLFLYTLTRDAASLQKNIDIDNKRVKENSDPLDENLQFAKLFNGEATEWCFFSNNLAKDDGFSTTSVKAYAPKRLTAVKSVGLAKSLFPDWPLPYRSAITCTIRQGSYTQNTNRKASFVGFLCLDSESRGVFIKKWDAQILFVFADALYWPLVKFQAAQNAAAEKGANLAS